MSNETLLTYFDAFAIRCHAASVGAGWYTDLKTGERIKRNVGEMYALMHSEVSEALEGYRKNLNDDKLPHRKMIEVELADTLIRLGDYAAYVGAAEDIGYNLRRRDSILYLQNGIIPDNVAEALTHIHKCLSKAFDEWSDEWNDDLVSISSAAFERRALTAAVIRIVTLADALNLDLVGAIQEKMAYNATRADHKIENRRAAGGKAF